jgi:glycosyltransferase involved in cell wall biosynthesis
MKKVPIIGMDGRMYSYSGIGRYIRMLVKHMGNKSRNRAYRFVIFSPDRFYENGFDHARSRSKPLSLLEQVDLARHNWGVSLNLFHSPQFNIPLLSRTPQVTTIHDCAYAKYPEEFSSLTDRLLHAIMFRAAVAKSQRIITVSQATKDDLLTKFKSAEGKIRVVHEGVDERFWHQPDADQAETVKSKYGIDCDYLLFVGVMRPRKNVEAILRAFATAHSGLSRNLKLIIVGPQDTRFMDIKKRARELNVGESVVLTGMVTDTELSCLYRSALCLVFPTLYEGFGLPILEAMASGTPVITSRRPAHMEIAGEAALLVDPLGIDDLTQAIMRIVEDEGLRKGLVEKGFVRAKAFSWDRCAEQTLDVYGEVLNG